MIDSIEKKKCTGCKMCADICPKSAITFNVDKEGFWYPSVDYQKCVKCKICLNKCPSLNEHPINKNDPSVYALWSKDDETRITSTSGGAFWEIANSFISDGGIVVGSRYGGDWRTAEHYIAHNTEELTKIKGSKYFQSDTAGIYKKVKDELSQGTKVLFCGTPCQISAIKTYIGIDDENLFCMDFICRSINSPKAFKAYIDELESQYNSKVMEVHLKNKDNGWQSLASQVRFENGDVSLKDKNNDWWVKGFIYNDLYTRESCYNCQYKVLPRINADITIGDFWGIKNQKSEDMFKGISVMLINTEKGQKLFNGAKENVICFEHSIDDVLPGNPALLTNPVRTSKQDKFFELLEKHPFSYCVEACIKENKIKKIRTKIYNGLRKIKHLGGMFLKNNICIRKYIYLNYFCKNIERKTHVKVIPHKNAIIELQKGSRIILSGEKDLHIGINKLKGSKAETHVRMNRGAIWNCTNGCDLFYNTVLEIKENAVFNTGYFSANGGSVIIAHKNINFGEDVMIGRNVTIYDSDFHTIYNKQGKACNPPMPVTVEDHVWLTSNIIVQKGVTIGSDSLITAYTTVNKDVPKHCIFGASSVGKLIRDEVSWGRDTCPKE